MRIAIAAAVACLSIVGITANAQVHAAIRKHTEIPSEPLDLALRSLAKDRGFQVVYLTEDVRTLQTRGAVGDFTIDEALKKLLSDSRLEYKFVDDNTVSIFSKSDSTSALEGRDRVGASARNEVSSGSSSKSSSEQFHVAEEDQTSTGSSALGDDRNFEKKKKEKDEGISEIVVTGTHISGTTSISPILQFDRAAIDRSGYLTTQEFMQSIPQAFAGGTLGASPQGYISGGYGQLNGEHASAVNLRGLGENATLILLNGHRMAPSDYGNVVDISTIPLSAIDHVDVLTDGASAIYGADAVAGVVNFVLKSGFTGAETHAAYSGAEGGLRNEIAGQTFGTSWSSGSIMGSYEYSHGGTLSTSERSFTADAPQPTNIINPFIQNSLIVNGNQTITDNLRLYGDAMATWKHTSAVVSYSPGGPGNTGATFSDSKGINVHLGLKYAINDRWHVELGGTYAQQKVDTGYNAYPVSIYPLGTPIIFSTTKTPELDLGLNGRVLTLPGGDLSLAVGVNRRHEAADVEQAIPPPPSLAFVRDVTAEYAEVRVPIVGSSNQLPGINQLVLSGAVRHDGYSDLGGTTNPKFGILWSLNSALDVKANWSKAFRPPSLGELWVNANEAPLIFLYPFANPSGAGTVPVLVLGGENTNLRPESAKTYDLAVDFHPPALPGLKLTIDYFNVDFTNRIISPPFDANALTHPDVYGPLIGHLPSDAAAAAYIAGLQAQGYQFLDLGLGYGTSPAGVRYTFPNQTINAAVVHQNGVDLNGSYSFEFGAEQLHTDLNVAFINKIDTQFAPGATPSNLVNTASNPLRLRLRWDGSWTHGPLELTTAVNYSNRYEDPYTIPTAPIASFTTIDVSAAIHLGLNGAGSIWDGTTIRFNAANLLDRNPPYVLNFAGTTGVNYDSGNASPIGRMLSVEIQKKW